MLAQLPVPRPAKEDVERIASQVAALVTTDNRFEDLKPLLKGRAPENKAKKRHEIKCLIDAEAARLFSLTEDELSRVLNAFDKVPDNTKAQVKAHFRDLPGKQ